MHFQNKHAIIVFADLKRQKFIACAPVAQLDRVLGYEPRGQEFESLRARQKEQPYKSMSVLFLPQRVSRTPASEIRTVPCAQALRRANGRKFQCRLRALRAAVISSGAPKNRTILIVRFFLAIFLNICYTIFATQLNNWTNYRRSIFIFGKNACSILAFSCSLSKLCRSKRSYAFFVRSFGCALFN